MSKSASQREVVRRIRLRLAARPHTVHVSTHAAAVLARTLERLRQRYIVVTDRNVARLVWPRLRRDLRSRGVEVAEPIVLAAGERHKNMRAFSELHERMLRGGLDRRSVLIALGGGVVTDLAGFAAATYMRGIDWIAAPTTLLGMVDAAVGGKVGINLQSTKNVVGAFHQPLSVVIGTDLLQTLPARERRNGMGEVVKYAMISDRRLFAGLEAGRTDLLDATPLADAKLVARCCRIKARYVESDEREAGTRAALNFGHTLGHALEGDGSIGLAHGEAVGLGMLAACVLAERLGVAREPQHERLEALLRRLGLPVRAPAAISRASVRRAFRRDKKSVDGVPRFVLTPKIGSVRLGFRPTPEQIERALDAVLQ